MGYSLTALGLLIGLCRLANYRLPALAKDEPIAETDWPIRLYATYSFRMQLKISGDITALTVLGQMDACIDSAIDQGSHADTAN